jgi:hypothetical protein
MFTDKIKAGRKFTVCLLLWASTTYALVFDKLNPELIAKLFVLVGGFYVGGNLISKALKAFESK